MFKNILLFVGCLITAIGAYAQTTPHLVSGSFSEKALAEVMLVKLAGNKSSRIAEFNISPANRNFVFVVPDDLTASYRLQINLMKPNGRHAKLERTCSVPLLLSSGSNYTLKITPSKLDTAKKTGWELKQDAGKSSFALVRGKISNSNFASSITLHSVADGNLVSASSFTTDQTGAFVIPVAVKKPGFYYLSSLRWRVRVYLNPLQKLEVNVDNKTGLMQSVKGSMMTQALYEWQQLIVPVTRYGYNLSTFNIDTVNLDAYIAEYKKLQPR